MKRIKVKRLVYTNIHGTIAIGGQEYSGSLTDDNILCSIHEQGKTAWDHNQLWLLRNGQPTYQITVETFYVYKRNWLDAVRRI